MTTGRTRPSPRQPPQRSWPVPVALLLLSAVPLLAGSCGWCSWLVARR